MLKVNFTIVSLVKILKDSGATFRKVKELDDKTISIGQLVNLYTISRTTVYKWLAKYSVHYHKETKIVVQMESEAHKLQAVLQRQAELE